MLKEAAKLKIHSNIYSRRLVSIRSTYHCQAYQSDEKRQTIQKVSYSKEITSQLNNSCIQAWAELSFFKYLFLSSGPSPHSVRTPSTGAASNILSLLGKEGFSL